MLLYEYNLFYLSDSHCANTDAHCIAVEVIFRGWRRDYGIYTWYNIWLIYSWCDLEFSTCFVNGGNHW